MSKWERIIELIDSWHSQRETQRMVASEFWSCSRETVMRYNRMTERYKMNKATLDSEIVERVVAENGVNKNDIWMLWIKVPTTEDSPWYSALIKMPDGKSEDYLEKIKEAVSSWSLSQVILPVVSPSDKSLFVVLSDMHVGLDWRWQYWYVYNEEVLKTNIERVLVSIRQQYEVHGTFDRIVLLDLWDGLDWWNWQTTRGWHTLQQNMDNAWQFKTYVQAKMNIISTILSNWWCSRLAVRNVTEDNHAGQFGLIANMAIDEMVKIMYPWAVDIVNYTNFMHHFNYGDNTFIITHGKDSTHQKYGLPLCLNPKAESYINNYINVNWLQTRKCHVLKWDLHQLAYGHAKWFSYHNFWSFAPPSWWVQANFGDCYSSFSLLLVEKTGSVSRVDNFIEYDKAPLINDTI